ncbi:uncharacterized protein LY79DRAFT_556286 [Colletotrichum navitas]|uniref:Uncharacterized protein n=1 Tax=Colletotrichum navitas TaxID=681940 RepID=A0AAD8PYD0_9PEZI|nr:uncharacterized protein LY79DRAFT_556286 [Colletotrichum navitas]KAK1589778.1 hypothetical protein LY79DRAFT_556286 [Colletotrichum navitas]
MRVRSLMNGMTRVRDAETLLFGGLLACLLAFLAYLLAHPPAADAAKFFPFQTISSPQPCPIPVRSYHRPSPRRWPGQGPSSLSPRPIRRIKDCPDGLARAGCANEARAGAERDI